MNRMDKLERTFVSVAVLGFLALIVAMSALMMG
jgi:hypothetical protein